MTGKDKIKIFISCHKPAQCITNEILQPIQLGCSLTEERIPDALHDDDGDNISDLNPQYCELTAQYWAWKNVDADYYGFCHYRRYFNFSDRRFKEDAYGNILEQYPGAYAMDKYGMSEENIRKTVEGYDIIITECKDIRKIPDYYSSLYEHYEEAPYLVAKDIHTLTEIIDEKYPEYGKYAHKFLNGHFTSFCNMYILRKEIFQDYCAWLFNVLGEFCRRVDMGEYGTEALRTPGHLSERLFGIYLLKLRTEKPNLKVKELQCVYFQETAPQEPLTPVFQDHSVPIVFAANNNFVPMFATCLQSVINTATDDRNYDIILTQTDISKENRQTLLDMVRNKPNFSLRFFNAAALLADYKLEAKEHISIETFYRFLIQEAMPGYDKVLYVDCDVVVKEDLAKLYDTNIEGYILAATRDPDFLGQVNGANDETKDYATSILKIDPSGYFQAGVILFNEAEMRKLHSLDEWLELATYPYRYSDQDLLNVACEGKVKYLDMRWNVLVDCNHERIRNVIAYAPLEIQREYNQAHADPYIIHYAGFKKPWHSPTEDFARDFWSTARQTPYYEELLSIMTDLQIQKEIKILAKNVSSKGRQVDRAKRLYHRCFKENGYVNRKVRQLLRKKRNRK